MHYYSRNIGDYHTKCGRLSILEHGVYALLMDACYDRERFPTEQEAIDWVWARTEEEEAAVRFVLKRYFEQREDDTWVQPRIEEEIAHYRKKAEKNREIALAREEARRTKRAPNSTNRTRGVQERAPEEHASPPNQEPITNNQEPIDKNPCPPSADSLGDLFENFWSAYPRKTKRQDAQKAFNRIKPDRAFTQSLIDDVRKRLNAGAWVDHGDERKFIPHPTTYLNGKRWEDEIIPRQGGSHGPHQQGNQSRKLTPAERTEAARQAAYRRQHSWESSDLGAVEADGGNVRPLLGQSTR